MALLGVPAFATNAVFIAQVAAGGNTGTSCANAKAYTYFNTAGNWSATPTGIQIGPDTTVNVCGTVTGTGVVQSTILTFQASGTSGHPITLLRDAATSGLITLPVCGTKDSGGCVDTANKTWVIIDGGGGNCGFVNGVDVACPTFIQSTANGTSLANQLTGVGIRATNCSNCEIRGLDISNIYVKSGTDNAPAGFSSDPSAIWISGSNWSVHNWSCNQTNHCLTDPFNNGDTGDTVAFATLGNMNQGVSIGNNNANTLSTLKLHDLHLKDMAPWDNPGNQYHHDGIFFFQDGAGTSAVSGVYLWNILGDGDIGFNCTAWVFYNSGLDGIYVFNSKFFNPAGRACAMLEGGFSGDRNYFLLNNYIDCGTAGRALQYSGVLNFTIENMAYNNCNEFMEGFTGITGSLTFDYNVFGITNNSSAAFHYNGSSLSFAGYRAAHSTFDANSNGSEVSTGTNSVGFPLAGSTLIHNGTNQFVDLTSLATGNLTSLRTDYAGVSRPNTSFGWDAGAYVFGSAPAVTLGPTSLNFGTVAVGSSLVQTVSMQNTGTATLTYTLAFTTGTDYSFGAGFNNCIGHSSIVAAGSCVMYVKFTPTTTGSRPDSIIITSNAASSPDSVPLSGIGGGGSAVVSLSPTTLPFPSQVINTNSTPQTIHLTNVGGSTLNISSIAMNTGTQFSETNTCSATVVAGASCDIVVTFRPTTVGAKTDSVQITDDAAGSPQSAPVSGTGITAPAGSACNFSGGIKISGGIICD